MKKVKLGDLEVNAVGFGAVGLSHGYGKGVSEEDGIKLIRDALMDMITLTQLRFMLMVKTKNWWAKQLSHSVMRSF